LISGLKNIMIRKITPTDRKFRVAKPVKYNRYYLGSGKVKFN